MTDGTFGALRPSSLRILVGVSLLVGSVGCQGKGTVSGKVSYQGKPVVFGTVLVLDSDQHIHQGNIEPDGSFTIHDIRRGEIRIAVSSPDPTTPLLEKPESKAQNDPAESHRRAELKTKWFPIPEKYGNPEQSGLTATVKGGENSHNIDLK